MTTTLKTLAAVLFAAAALGGCATVAPFERETLAREDMQFGGAAQLHLAEAHATDVREGSIGGLSAGGGGCGCN